MTKIELKLVDGTVISKTLSWGVHKELTNYLMEDSRLMVLFTNDEVSENVLQICLSERDTYGNISAPFMQTSMLEVSSMLEFLTDLHEYFENFFFQNQQRVSKMGEKFQQLQNTNQ